MKKVWIILVLSVLMMHVPLFSCQCQAGDAHQSARMSNQDRQCCESENSKQRPSHENKPCCGQCLSPLAAGAVSENAVLSEVVTQVFDKLSFISTHNKPIIPELYLIRAVSERDNPFLFAVFQFTYSSRAPPIV
jgi:hypothetical protein